MKKYGSGTYREGFADGWRAIKGAKTKPPTFLARPIPEGKTPYQIGYDHAVECAHAELARA
jgi:hypothetical protein